MTARRMLAVAAVGLVLTLPGSAAAQYTFTTVDVPGGTNTAVNGNSPNAIAGQFDDEVGNTHGFVRTNKGFTQIDHPDADGFTTVNGINANGELAGIFIDANGKFHGFFYSKGKFTTLDYPGSIRTSAFFLNAQGDVVGTYRSSDNVRHGFVWSKGKFTSFDAPNAATPLGTSGVGINDTGTVVGTYVDKRDNLRYGFILSSKGAFTQLQVPGSDFTVAQGVNNPGTVAGLYQDDDGVSHGFVYSKGKYTTVDVPGSQWTEIYSINAQGQIVGAYADADGVQHGFVGTPSH